MMKYLMFLLFLLFMLKFNKKMFWMMQNYFFFMLFIFIMNNFYLNYWMNISYFLGCDIISYGLIILTMWILSLMIIASSMIWNKNNNLILFCFMLLILLLFLFLTFSSMNLFLFYLFFESSLIPTMFLILGWGYQPERLQAGIYLLFYTLFASLPMMLTIFYLYMNLNILNFLIFSFSYYNYLNWLMYICMIFAFLVKMPMFLVHLWLPKAHVEAPISGSMILAGVLLKLGGYGILRILGNFQLMNLKMNYIFISISLVGGLLISLICLRQMDLKSLIAYSSVAHMGLVLGGMFSMFYWGMSGAYLLMIAHGLCSSGMFCLANISYERIGSRSLLINKGLLNFMPSMTLLWFLILSMNMAAPPSLNLLSEISLLNSLVSWSMISMIMLMLMSFFSAAYSLYLYSYSQHGILNYSLYSYSSGYIREYLLLFLHWLPLNLLILKSETFILWL